MVQENIRTPQYVIEKYGAFIDDMKFFPMDGKWYKFKNVIVDRTQTNRPYDIKDNPLFRQAELINL